jgi:hypothetical protein
LIVNFEPSIYSLAFAICSLPDYFQIFLSQFFPKFPTEHKPLPKDLKNKLCPQDFTRFRKFIYPWTGLVGTGRDGTGLVGDG